MLALSLGSLRGASSAPEKPVTLKDGLVDTAAVHHDPNGLDQVLWATAENPALRFLFLRVAMKPDDVLNAGARIYSISDREYEAFKDYDMDPYARTTESDFRSVTIPFEDEPSADDLHSHWRGYHLWLDDGEKIFWVGPDSIATKEDKVPRYKELVRRITPHYGSEVPAETGVSDRVLSIPAWVQDAIVYRVQVDRFKDGDSGNNPAGAPAWDGAPVAGVRFGGDLRGIILALPYLDSLGVTTVSLSPIFHSADATDDAIADFDSVDAAFGTEAVFKQLVAEAHKRRMHILLEGELSHVSETHPYFQDAVNFGVQSDLWKWFRFRDYPVVKTPEPNYAVAKSRADLPAWNLENADTRNYMVNVVRRWLELDADGWVARDPDEAPHEFWYLFREAAKAMNARAWMIGDVPGDVRTWNLGDQFDAVRDDRLRDACLGFFADTTLDAPAFDDRLSRIRISTPDPLNRIAFQAVDRPGETRLLTRFGDREPWLRLMILFQLTYTGAPVLSQGDEIGQKGDAGLRGTFPWRIADQDAPLREFYRRLILLRRDHSALRRGSFHAVYAEGGVYGYVRRSAEEVLLVVLNRTATPATFKLPLPRGAVAVSQKDAVDLLSGTRHGVRSNEIYLKEIPALSGVVLRLR